jgi:hypothetical protein
MKAGFSAPDPWIRVPRGLPADPGVLVPFAAEEDARGSGAYRWIRTHPVTVDLHWNLR